ncbi:MAG: single-stranded-DNA-specific exonuclease RecJ, partial [Burkholderiales bacterium]
MREKLWVFQQVSSAQQAALAQALSISPITASVLLGRGITTPDEAGRWLALHTDPSHDPFLLPDMERAVDRLRRAIDLGERICFYGDYDVDGVSATSIYLSFFQSLGANAHVYIPHRLHEGYGLNAEAIRSLHQDGVSLVVTSDCGTTSHREIELANQLSIDVVVTDHHQPEERLPPALALLNPYRADAVYPFKGLCSGGLAYKVVQAYHMKYETDFPIDTLHDLVALSTIADIVPLQDENRRFVREGLAQMSRGARCGIRALKQVAGITRDCTAETVAFKLAPRLNAAGRLAHALLGVQLLTTESEPEARQLAEELDRLNRERQQIEEKITTETLASVDRDELPAAFVLGARSWHLGVVGIVAARLVDRFHRPAVVMAINEQGIAKGSARTIPGFDLYQALTACRDLLVAYGGHPSAAGLTVEEARIPELRERFSQLAATATGGGRRVQTLHVDAEVNLAEVNLKLIRELGTLHPFGAGNPEPTLAVRNLSVLN